MNNTSVKLDDALVAKVRKMKSKGFTVSGFFNAAGQAKLRGSLISRLKKDKKLFETFQANITVSVITEPTKSDKPLKRMTSADLVHHVSEGAHKFLLLLIDDKKSPAGR